MSAGQTFPLLERNLTSAIAHLARPLPSLGGRNGIVEVADFLGHVHRLADQLPDSDHLVNLCGNRYLFMVSFCAAVLRGQVSLLPPNYNPATQVALAERHRNCYVLHDGIAVAEDLPELNLEHVALGGDGVQVVPEIAGDQLAAISFTSGSTGQSKPNPKPWRTKFRGGQLNRRYMLPDAGLTRASMLATVPGQHMWGLETSVILALMADLCVSDQRPLYPADICKLLSALPEPRLMVSTPVHLRAMVKSGLSFPRVERVLCATAPLDPSLAARVESTFGGTLYEIYGCSELGSMAGRRTVEGVPWSLFDAMQLTPSNDGTIATADHVPGTIQMQDLIEIHADRRFSLMGRQTDLIDIAGKRGSLKELNQVLTTMDGVVDGVVFLPTQSRAVPRLAALVVLDRGVTTKQVADHFRAHLDPAFVPRRIMEVEALPRAASGKLPDVQVTALYESLIGSR